MSSFLKRIAEMPPPQDVFPNPMKKPKRQRGRKKVVAAVSPLETAPKPPVKKKRKQKIPAALREQVWIHKMGRVFEGKCPTAWCQNTITVFDFQSGHNIPESKGGPTTLDNLIPICSRCNLSMGDTYTIEEWSNILNDPSKQDNLSKTTDMAPKLMSDEDGDIPPCSVMHSYKSAKEWDEYKQKKYNGKQKAKSVVKRFRKARWSEFLYKWFRISLR